MISWVAHLPPGSDPTELLESAKNLVIFPRVEAGKLVKLDGSA